MRAPATGAQPMPPVSRRFSAQGIPQRPRTRRAALGALWNRTAFMGAPAATGWPRLVPPRNQALHRRPRMRPEATADLTPLASAAMGPRMRARPQRAAGRPRPQLVRAAVAAGMAAVGAPTPARPP